MIAFDTNVLLRLLVVDDEKQAKRAQALLGRAVDANESVLLPEIVLCELAWVLKSLYGQSRSEIVEVLRLLLETEPFAFVNRSAVCQALTSMRKAGRLLRLHDRLFGYCVGRDNDLYL